MNANIWVHFKGNAQSDNHHKGAVCFTVGFAKPTELGTAFSKFKKPFVKKENVDTSLA